MSREEILTKEEALKELERLQDLHVKAIRYVTIGAEGKRVELVTITISGVTK